MFMKRNNIHSRVPQSEQHDRWRLGQHVGLQEQSVEEQELNVAAAELNAAGSKEPSVAATASVAGPGQSAEEFVGHVAGFVAHVAGFVVHVAGFVVLAARDVVHAAEKFGG